LRRTVLLAALGAAALAMPAPASAAPDIRTLLNFNAEGHCPEYGGVEICSGWIPSWDGTKIDVDVTLPRNDGGRARHPLIVLLHGLGANKHEWEWLTDEGDGRNKWHWNNRWFAHHGYAASH
jgi:dipeptidyl aminopeptidase/acylaminoacyl peptidase